MKQSNIINVVYTGSSKQTEKCKLHFSKSGHVLSSENKNLLFLMLSDPVVYIHFILKDESCKKTEKRGTEKQKK